MKKMPKPVYLDEGHRKNRHALITTIYVLVFLLVAFGIFVVGKHTSDQRVSDKELSCDLLLIAFDEAQLAPGWYQEAGQVLKTCNKGVDDTDILGKVCSANRWNGYETQECLAFEKSRQ